MVKYKFCEQLWTINAGIYVQKSEFGLSHEHGDSSLTTDFVCLSGMLAELVRILYTQGVYSVYLYRIGIWRSEVSQPDLTWPDPIS